VSVRIIGFVNGNAIRRTLSDAFERDSSVIGTSQMFEKKQNGPLM